MQAGGKGFLQELDLVLHQMLVESQEWTDRIVHHKVSALAETF
jgi:hypothetical protein